MNPAEFDRLLGAAGPVSRETYGRLAALVALVKKWQRAENLVAASTLDTIWTRHVADSAQLVAVFPKIRHWLDLGSGGGFPGLVTAILLGDGSRDDGTVHLVESNARKCAFLRTAVRDIGAPAVVHHGRIEDILARFEAPVEAISARALASRTRASTSPTDSGTRTNSGALATAFASGVAFAATFAATFAAGVASS